MMMPRLKTASWGPSLVLALAAPAMAQPAVDRAAAAPAAATAQAAVIGQIKRYVASINSGDTKAAARLWADSDEITFINTTGIHQGWPAIDRAVHSFFRDRFSKRDLRLVMPPRVQLFGRTAVAEFTWDFDGTMTTSKELHTRGGRESQVYVLTAKGEWRLVHAHYSLQPPTPGS